MFSTVSRLFNHLVPLAFAVPGDRQTSVACTPSKGTPESLQWCLSLLPHLPQLISEGTLLGSPTSATPAARRLRITQWFSQEIVGCSETGPFPSVSPPTTLIGEVRQNRIEFSIPRSATVSWQNQSPSVR